MNKLSLPDTIKALAEQRAVIAAAVKAREAAQKALEATPEWEALKAAEETFWRAKEQEEIHREAVEAAALAAYEETGNKRPCEGVEIKIYTQLIYDAHTALRWAMGRGLETLLKLDKRQFVKAAKTLNPEFVRQEQEPRVFISKDLTS